MVMQSEGKARTGPEREGRAMNRDDMPRQGTAVSRMAAPRQGGKMAGDNLPPGVRESDIPGNRPEDMEWERLFEWLGDTGLTPLDIRRAVQDLLDGMGG